MTATALRSKNNFRRLLYFLGLSLAVHLVMLVGFSIDYIFGVKHAPASEAAETPPAASAPATVAPATKPAPTAVQPAGVPLAPTKPKDADAEYQKRQQPLSEPEKRKAETIRPDLDQLK